MASERADRDEAETRASPPVLAPVLASVRKPITAGKLRKAERNQRIAAAYAAGEECREIAAREGLSRARVLSIVNAEGVPSRQVGKNRRIPDLDRQAVADLYANGMPLRAVADRFGVSKSTAKACLIELGAQLRPVGKRSPAYRPKPKIKSAATRLSKGASATTLTPAPEGTSGGVTGGCYESPANAGEQHEKPAAAVLRQAQDERVEVAAAAARISDTGELLARARRKAKAERAAEQAAADERRIARRSQRATEDDAAVSEFEAALAKVRARKAGAVEVIAPKPAAPQDEGKRLAAAFAAKAVQKSKSVPAATGPSKPAPGREECPRCGIPGWKGCAHFLPCEDQPVLPSAEQLRHDANSNPLRNSMKFTGKRQGIGASCL